MSYEKFYPNGWQSGEAGGTPITPEALNHMEAGIAASAPAGFGYGESMPILNYASKDELLAALDELLLSMPFDSRKQIAIASTGLLGYAYVFYCTLTRAWTGYSTLEGFSYDGARFDMYQLGGTWSPVRWINPSMTVGVEYCTHERYNGLPVYSKVVSIPSLPNKSTATVSHGAACTRMLRCDGRTSAGETLPYAGWGAYINLMANLGSIILESNYDASALTAEVQFWYTKD